MTTDEFTSRSLELLGSVASKSGKVIYSAATTFQQGPFYIIGENPGGIPENVSETIETSLKAFSSKKCNDYLDERWQYCGKNRERLC